MTKIDLTIPADMIAFFERTIALLPGHEFVLSVTKGALDDGEDKVWVFDIMPKETAEDLRREFMHDCMAYANGCEVFVYPYDLIWELEGKRFQWGEEHVELVDNAK